MFTNTAVRPIVPLGWPCLPVAMRPLHLLVSCFFLFSVTRVATEGTTLKLRGSDPPVDEQRCHLYKSDPIS